MLQPFCLSGRVCSQADVFPVSRPPKTTQQVNSHANATLHRFPSKLLHSGNTHQSPCSHLTKFRVQPSRTHPHGEQDEKASVRPSLHNKCSFKPPQPVSIGPPPACKIGQMSRMPFHSEDKHSFTTSSPTLEIGLNRPQRGDAGSDRLATGRVGGRCAV
jgi:hypothetical protein